MRDCAFCSKPLTPRSEWKGTGGQFYCNEFCADSEETSNIVARANLRDGAQTAGAHQ